MAMEREGKWPRVGQGSVGNWPEGLDLLWSCEGVSEDDDRLDGDECSGTRAQVAERKLRHLV
jgi:hypothetical protein